MYVSRIKAEPNAGGGQIDLFWKNPSKDVFPGFKGIKIVRRERRFPKDINDGILIYNNEEDFDKERSFSDKELKGETVYYYTFFTFTYGNNSNPPQVKHFTSRSSRITAMATSNYALWERLYQLIPAIYKCYDENKNLQRFMEIFGSQLDLIRSFATGALRFFDLDECDGELLPLLAQWIGWQTNRSMDYDSQRNEIRYAPEIYKTVGTIPNLRALMNHLTDWNCQIKEFVHNVFLSNDPEKLNIWAQRLIAGNWSDAELLSLDFAYGGAPSAFMDLSGRIWLFYHTKGDNPYDSRHKWDIWYKIFDQGEWSPAYRITHEKTIDMYPVALKTKEGAVWLFWNSYNEDERIWEIRAKIFAVGQDTADVTLIGQECEPSFSSGSQNNMEPAAFEDDIGHLWLFWSSHRDKKWNIWYNKFDGTSWNIEQQLTSGIYPDREPTVIFFDAPDPVTNTQRKIWIFWSRKELPFLFELTQGSQSNLDNATITEGLKEEFENNGISLSEFAKILIKKTGSRWLIIDKINYLIQKKENKLHVYGPERWNIFYTTKPNAEWNESVWHEEKVLSEIPCGHTYDNREPAVIKMDSQGKIPVFWSSNRSGSWNIWYKCFDKTNNQWSEEIQATFGYFSKRAPAVTKCAENDIWLFFRSNESIVYSSQINPSAIIFDDRYSGSTTIDIRNRQKIGEHKRFRDIMHYTYDSGIENESWYARDTIGIFLTPNADDKKLIIRNRELLKGFLDRFLPIRVRAVFILNPPIYKELIYTYDFDEHDPQYVITERFFDNNITEMYPELNDTYTDKALGWIWIRSWSFEYQDHYTVNPKFRTWHIGLEPGE